MNCVDCIAFNSYENIYEDPQEPWDIGKCTNPNSPKFGNQVSDSDVCNCYKPIPVSIKSIMVVEVKDVVKDYTACNFCRRATYSNNHNLIYPYKQVFEIGIITGGITVAICQQCLDELKDKTKDIKLL